MINQILKHGTTIGIVLSFIGLIILRSFELSDEFVSIIDKIHQITIFISCLFILTVSGFINEKFNKLLKFAGIIFLIMLGLNLLKEFNVYQVKFLEPITLILLSGIYFMYFNYFRKKNEKNILDYLKISFLSLVFITAFLIEFNLRLDLLNDIKQIFYWIVITGILYNEYAKSRLTSPE